MRCNAELHRTARKPTFAITIGGPSENVKLIRCKTPFLPQTGKATNARACETSRSNRGVYSVEKPRRPRPRGYGKGELRLPGPVRTRAPRNHDTPKMEVLSEIASGDLCNPKVDITMNQLGRFCHIRKHVARRRNSLE